MTGIHFSAWCRTYCMQRWIGAMLIILSMFKCRSYPYAEKTYLFILIDLFIACGNADMHATPVFCVVVFCGFFFYFNRDVLFYYAYVFHTSQDICMCTHWNIYVFIPYIFHVFYLYFAWYNCFVLACLEHLHLKIESCANTTLSYLIQKALLYTIFYFAFCWRNVVSYSAFAYHSLHNSMYRFWFTWYLMNYWHEKCLDSIV